MKNITNKKPRFVVRHISYLNEEEREIWGNAYYCLVDTKTNTIVGCDGGEPEDQLLIRDLRWGVDALNNLNDEIEHDS